jgi:hypothetical protein
MPAEECSGHNFYKLTHAFRASPCAGICLRACVAEAEFKNKNKNNNGHKNKKVKGKRHARWIADESS